MSEEKNIQEIVNSLIPEIPKWNGKQCGEGCNCLDIAEAENNGPVKDYPCQSPHTPFDEDKFKS